MEYTLKYVSKIQESVIDDLISKLRKKCLLTDDVEETIKLLKS